MKMTKPAILYLLLLTLIGCGGGGSSSSAPAPAPTPTVPPDPVTIVGSILDGPVVGGRIFLFSADDITVALQSAASASDRADALVNANPVASLVRVEADGSDFSLELNGDLAGEVLFLVFDAAGASDEVFGDEPFNMESVATIAAAGSNQRINITPHTSLITIQVRDAMSDDASRADQTAIDAAAVLVLSAGSTDQLGNTLIPDGLDIFSTDDADVLEAMSVYIGELVRTGSAITGLTRNEVLHAIAADSADGTLDGIAPASFTDDEASDNASTLALVVNAGRIEQNPLGGSCSTVASLLGKACEFDMLDDFLEGRAICLDTDEENDFRDCMADVAEEQDENIEECADVLAAQLDLCDDLNDGVHDPAFGEAFAANFVDPLEIGSGITPNPWFPLVTGNQWIYEGAVADDDGESVIETITVTVTSKTKLIQGITCVVVNDVAMEDDEIVENTDDWLAQDIEGNIWYCGEISRNFESNVGDEPRTPELVDIEGSWKAGRDGAEAGILLPGTPEAGDVIRQEVLFNEAEDVIQIESLEGSESAPGGSCAGNCLVTLDFTPMESDSEENKYYVPGLGLIVEIDLETGERVELQSFTSGP